MTEPAGLWAKAATVLAKLSRRGDPGIGTGLICGCGHSGTSLIANMLAGHPAVFIPLEETTMLLGDEGNAKRSIRSLKREARRTGKSLLVEKTPSHVHRIALARKIAPDVKLLLMVRDGRDSVTSLAARLDGDLDKAIDRWIRDNRAVLAERGQPDVFVLRYEDLIEEPREALAAVCQFLGLEFQDTLLDFHKHRRMWFGQTAIANVGADEHEAYRNWQINQPLFDGRGKWRKTYTGDDMRRLTDGDGAAIMEAFGYGGP